MDLKDFEFSITEKQQRYRQKMIQELLAHPDVKAFMDHYHCSEAFIAAHAGRFQRWIDDKKQAASYSERVLKEDPALGHYVELRYNQETQALDEYLVAVEFVEKLNHARKHLRHYRVFSLPDELGSAFFETIDIHGENPKYIQLMKKMIEFATDDHPGYYVHGDLGVGKSYLCACVTNLYATMGRSVAFAHVPSLLTHLKHQFNSFNESTNVIEQLKNVSLLVLDDLGAESVTAWSRDEVLLAILNQRLASQKKTIISSNCKPDMLLEVYSLDNKGNYDELRARRLVDRVFSLCTPVEMVGTSRRNR